MDNGNSKRGSGVGDKKFQISIPSGHLSFILQSKPCGHPDLGWAHDPICGAERSTAPPRLSFDTALTTYADAFMILPSGAVRRAERTLKPTSSSQSANLVTAASSSIAYAWSNSIYLTV